MKNISFYSKLIQFSSLIFLATACATPAGNYFRNRAADLSDVVSLDATAGLNAHGLVHVTDLARVALGVSVRDNSYGAVSGIRFGVPRQLTEPDEDNPLPRRVREQEARERNRANGAGPEESTTPPPPPSPARSRQHARAAVSIPALSITPGLVRGTPLRDYPLSEVPQPWLHFLDIDVSASLLLGAHVGFSPGELLDFFSGWAGVDLARDDVHP